MPLRALDPALRHTARAATTALRPSRLSAQPAFYHDAQRSIGQVWLPDMARIEAVAEAPVAIVRPLSLPLSWSNEGEAGLGIRSRGFLGLAGGPVGSQGPDWTAQSSLHAS